MRKEIWYFDESIVQFTNDQIVLTDLVRISPKVRKLLSVGRVIGVERVRKSLKISGIVNELALR